MARIESSSNNIAASTTYFDSRYVNIPGDTMTGALTIGLNGSILSLGDNTNSSVYSNIQGTRSYVGYDANGYAVLQGGASKGLRLNVNNATFGVGTAVEIDTAGQFKMANATAAGTGILLGGDVNLYRSAANTLRTDDSVVVPNLDSLSVANLTNTSYTMSVSAAGSYPAFSPVPKYLWHDMLSYQLWWGTPTHETYDGAAWNSAALNKAYFSNKEGTGSNVIDGVTNTAARWTWNNSNVGTSYANWWVIGMAYHGVTPSNKNILVESSSDGTNWTTRHTSSNNTAHFTPIWLYVSDWASSTYIRLTITVTNSQPLTISTIKALSGRWGNQGGGSENNLPYTWDNDGRITVGTGTGGIAGTTSYSNGALNVGLSTATTAAQGIFFGTDTNLYRSAANQLQTNDSLVVDANLTVGTGTTSVNTFIRGSSFNGITTDIYGDSPSAYSYFRRTRGSVSSPTVVTSGSFLGSFGFRGYADAGMNNQDSARISGYATQDFDTTHGGAIAFYTAANGTLVSSGASQRMTIYSDGNVGIGVTVPTFKLQLVAATTAAGGIGFGTDVTLYRQAANQLATDDRFYSLGGLTTGANDQTSNLFIGDGSGKTDTTLASLQIGGATTTSTRVTQRGSSLTMTANASYAGWILGTDNVNEASTGTHPLITRMAFLPLSVTGAGATTTDAATVYIEGPMTGITPSGNNLSLWVDAGDSKFDANVDAATYSVAGAAGASGTFTTADAKTVTVTNGLITSIV